MFFREDYQSKIFSYTRMSSVFRSFATTYKTTTKFFDIITPSYNDNVIVSNKILPIPFTVANGVLDINVNQSSDILSFVNNGTIPVNDPDTQVKYMGGTAIVNSFGPNMVSWVRKLIENQESLGGAYTGPLNIYVKPVMTKIQCPAPSQRGALGDGGVWGITTEAPSSDDYNGGDSTNNFFTSFVFKTPLTIQFEITGVGYKYFTLTSQFSED